MTGLLRLSPARAVAVFAAAAAFAAVPAAAAPSHRANAELTVMTRNLYLGADLSPILSARSLDEVLAAATAVWSEVQANDFTARARGLAAEIAAAKPDVVALQEASLYRTDRPVDGPITPAETVAQDFLRTLVDSLEARGQSYRVVATWHGGDTETPVGLPPTMDVRFTDRISMLVRTDGARRGIRLRQARVGSYAAGLSVRIAGATVRVPRGWIAATLVVRGAKIVVVNTHLESGDAQVRAAQGRQLLAGVSATKVPIVLLGDFNSGPGTDTTVYDALRAAGFQDAWAQVGGATAGLTCCFAEDLRSTAKPLSSRVDLVLFKNRVRAIRADVVGEAPEDRVNGLWPSDHAGVVATLRVP